LRFRVFGLGIGPCGSGLMERALLEYRLSPSAIERRHAVLIRLAVLACMRCTPQALKRQD
jgi:hypothetical protein